MSRVCFPPWSSLPGVLTMLLAGVCAPVTEVCRIAHEHGALAFCDYAAAAPYLAFDQSAPHCPDAIGEIYARSHLFFIL